MTRPTHERSRASGGVNCLIAELTALQVRKAMGLRLPGFDHRDRLPFAVLADLATSRLCWRSVSAVAFVVRPCPVRRDVGRVGGRHAAFGEHTLLDGPRARDAGGLG
jgi:hypothetical protein